MKEAPLTRQIVRRGQDDADFPATAHTQRNDLRLTMQTDMLSSAASHSLAAAMQTPSAPIVEAPAEPYVCPDCDEQACVCWDYDAPTVDAFKAEQARRKSSIALCGTCKHTEKAHGSISGSCLQKVGGRFDGASDQSRCRCTKFVAAEQSDTLAADLLTSVVLAQGKAIARLKEQVSGLLARETV